MVPAALFTTLFGLEYIQCSVLSIAIPIVTFSVVPAFLGAYIHVCETYYCMICCAYPIVL